MGFKYSTLLNLKSLRNLIRLKQIDISIKYTCVLGILF
jgi:hypothetical protein